MPKFWYALFIIFLMGATNARASEARVAVAANFTAAATEIGALFTKVTGYKVRFSFGSTGTLYAQIAQGAPFDAFLAADQLRPSTVLANGLAVAGSRFTYATGRIVLFSMDKGTVAGAGTLKNGSFARLAIANPLTAPYGAAAIQAMKALGVYDTLKGKIVEGTNIAQTYQYVRTGNAEVGFVALSQVAVHDQGSRWVVPENLYAPIAQDAVLLKRGSGNAAARAFLDFLKGKQAAAVKKKYGYGPGK